MDTWTAYLIKSNYRKPEQQRESAAWSINAAVCVSEVPHRSLLSSLLLSFWSELVQQDPWLLSNWQAFCLRAVLLMIWGQRLLKGQKARISFCFSYQAGTTMRVLMWNPSRCVRFVISEQHHESLGRSTRRSSVVRYWKQCQSLLNINDFIQWTEEKKKLRISILKASC